MRGPIYTALGVFGAVSGIGCILFFGGYFLQRREATADEAAISFTLLLAISEGISYICCMSLGGGTMLSYFV
ncbi:hypothetical protein [Bartonella gabonensis]|uniref:hypothetical protein n=1 Tax=Bartonella gabonensis TaxID=2699889 RepID=UPI001FEC113D|nr:hypothetical protein [Bartonella gabonensis]